MREIAQEQNLARGNLTDSLTKTHAPPHAHGNSNARTTTTTGTRDAAAFAAMLATPQTFRKLRLREDFDKVWARTAFVVGAEEYDVEIGEEQGGIVVKIEANFCEEEAIECLEMVGRMGKGGEEE